MNFETSRERDPALHHRMIKNKKGQKSKDDRSHQHRQNKTSRARLEIRYLCCSAFFCYSIVNIRHCFLLAEQVRKQRKISTPQPRSSFVDKTFRNLSHNDKSSSSPEQIFSRHHRRRTSQSCLDDRRNDGDGLQRRGQHLTACSDTH